MRTLFKWFFRIAFSLFLVLVVLIVAALLLKDTLLKAVAEKNLRDSTGMDARISRLEVSLGTPTVNMEGLKLYNTAAFGGGTFLDLPELRMEYVLDEIRDGKLRFKTLRINIAELAVVKDKNGNMNVEALDKTLKERKRREPRGKDSAPVEFGGIDELYLSIGKVRVIDLANPKNSQEINVGLKDEVGRNFKTEEEMQGWFATVLLKLTIQQMLTNPTAQDGIRSLIDPPKKPKRTR